MPSTTSLNVQKIRRKNTVLIGMPGAGKSTVGRCLAMRDGLGFIDTDALIAQEANCSLQELVDTHGYLALRKLEQKCLLSLDCSNTVISTGGSAVYSHQGMKHLRNIGTVVYLRYRYETIVERVADFGKRGLAKPSNQSFEELYRERLPLYINYADEQLDCENLNVDEVCSLLSRPEYATPFWSPNADDRTHNCYKRLNISIEMNKVSTLDSRGNLEQAY